VPSQDTLIGIAVIAILIISLGLHEMAHAAVANWRGDDTAKKLGRLTPNPIKHIDPVMTVALPLFLWFVLPALTGAPRMIFGGAKPVPVQTDRLYSRHRDMALVAIAGPLMNFALAFIGLMIFQGMRKWGSLEPTDMLGVILYQSAIYNILLGIFNLLPIPPLDGSRVVSYLLPESLRRSYNALERMGLLLVIAFVFLVPGTQDWLFASIREVYDVMAAAIDGIYGLGGKSK
jgi:Zn-dependent protease